MKTIYLRKGKTESLQRFHPWVFSGAIARTDDGIEEGDLVNVVSSQGEFLAQGHYQPGTIAVRVLSFEPQPLGPSFWEQRLAQAYALRSGLGLTSNARTNAYRLVHGEGDCLPGLIIDVYGDTAVMQAHTFGMHRQREAIAQTLPHVSHGQIRHVYYKSSTTLPAKARDEQSQGFLFDGQQDEGPGIAIENGLKFHIDWLHGQKTGFFVDQRENRSLLEHYAQGRAVLNMFCYTGGFSVYALRGGARLVHSVDSSATAIDLTRANIALNFPDAETEHTDGARHQAFAQDAFHFLDHSSPAAYDLIVLDPPAFAKHRGALPHALKGYTRLNAIAFEKISKGGIIFTFSCSQAVSPQQFRLAVFTAAARSGRHVRLLHQLHQPADHPVSLYHPEGEYLKGLVLHVE